MKQKQWLLSILILLLSSSAIHAQTTRPKPMNIIFILADDHRYDAMGFMNKIKGLQTPGMDRMAKEGAHLTNAFVSTALCSPSRASILTGQYAHTHTVVDNDAPLPVNLTFFPQHLQKSGYQTAFLGKWHMGNTDDRPQPGFDHWVSFQGQGVYYDPTFNINGQRIVIPQTCSPITPSNGSTNATNKNRSSYTSPTKVYMQSLNLPNDIKENMPTCRLCAHHPCTSPPPTAAKCMER
jgi:N-acetylglucosamine-6-sulfatase